MNLLPVPESIEPFVKDIFLLENQEENTVHNYPFYADGFPGIIYSNSTNPFYLQPKNKKLSDFYLYGQTIEPIILSTKGPFKLYCMRLFPFAVRILLGVDAKVLNDDCYDLRLIENINTDETLKKLFQTEDHSEVLEIIADYFNELLKEASVNPDYRIKLAINLIMKTSGNVSIKEIRERLSVAERTLERQFVKEIGVTPKQFAKIIQFSTSMKQLTEADYVNLTDISYDSGFADQSHFIRSFKRYTGKTPKEFQQQLSA
jgi:AraC-like DNA-binding protein